ncbi:MAG: hypothetical protein ACI9OJ_003711, partial [Myxococcota bacterium]
SHQTIPNILPKTLEPQAIAFAIRPVERLTMALEAEAILLRQAATCDQP